MALIKRPTKIKPGSSRHQSWYVVYYVKVGNQRKKKFKSIGRVGDMLKSTARAIHDEMMRDRRLGRLDYLMKVPTFSEFVPEFLDYQRTRVRPHTMAMFETALRTMSAFFGDRKLTTIGEGDVRDFVQHREKQGRSPATIKQNTSILRSVFAVAKRLRRYTGENPVGSFKYKLRPQPVGKVLTPAEETKLLDAIPPHHRPLVETALRTGMRKNELLRLQWHDVDFENGFIYVRETKNAEPRKVPLSHNLQSILTVHKLKTGYQPYVFLSLYKKPYYVDTIVISLMMREACRKAEIRPFRFHDLRHTAATRMLERGAPAAVVAKILGHSNLQTIMIYTHPDASLRDAVELLSEDGGHKLGDKA